MIPCQILYRKLLQFTPCRTSFTRCINLRKLLPYKTYGQWGGGVILNNYKLRKFKVM